MRPRISILRVLVPLAAVLLASAPADAQARDTAAAARRVAELADRLLADYFRENPDAATRLAIPGARHDRLPDNSLAAVRRRQAREDSLWREVERIDAQALRGRPEWITYGFLRETLEASRATRVCRGELWPVNQMSGWQVELATLAGAQPVGVDSMRAHALARFGALPRYLRSETDNLREGVRRGFSTPKRNVRLVIDQLDALLAAAPEQSPFHAPASRDSTPAFRAAWRALLVDSIHPALRAYRDFLANEYLPAAREEIAIAAHPDGRDCWRAAYRSYTTVDRSPEEVFALGQRTVARNRERMTALGRELFGTADPAAIVARIGSDTANRFRTRDEVMAFSREAVERAKAAVPRAFATVPRAPVAIEPIPAFRERAASAHYEPPADDGSRPGTYFIRLYAPEEQRRGVAEITAFHETYPGHHLQIAIAQERPAAHAITRFVFNSGFTEGWARYAEALSEELGLYRTPYARVGRLAWPARGMVVDPGLHVLGWTREQAVDYILEAGSRSRAEAEVLVDRIVVWPAQLTAYDTGALEIFALREEAERRLGSRFDLREFHSRLLEDGSLTLRMLREKMERWMDEKGGGR